MEREAIEVHDSVVARIDHDGHETTIYLGPAYVHRSSGEPAQDAGAGWSVDVALTVSHAVVGASPDHLPCKAWVGTWRAGTSEFENVVPLPFEYEGDVLVTIELASGEVLNVSGKRVQVRVTGAYEFVQTVSAG